YLFGTSEINHMKYATLATNLARIARTLDRMGLSKYSDQVEDILLRMAELMPYNNMPDQDVPFEERVPKLPYEEISKDQSYYNQWRHMPVEYHQIRDRNPSDGSQ